MFGPTSQTPCTHAELDRRREVVKITIDLLLESRTAVLVGRKMNERGRDDALLALDGADDFVGELGTGIRHGEGGGPRTILGLDHLVATELDAVGQSLESVLGEARWQGVGGLRQQGNDLWNMGLMRDERLDGLKRRAVTPE